MFLHVNIKSEEGILKFVGRVAWIRLKGCMWHAGQGLMILE